MNLTSCSSCGQFVYCLENKINAASFCFACLDKHHSEFRILRIPGRNRTARKNGAIRFFHRNVQPHAELLVA